MNEKDVERIIINGVTELIGKSVGSLDKMIHLIKGFFLLKHQNKWIFPSIQFPEQ